MNLMLVCVFAPTLLLCAIKLSLVERAWEIALSALIMASVPLVLHRFAVRMSLLEVEQLIRARATLALFAALVAFEALTTLLLIAAVSAAHVEATASDASTRQRVPTLFSGLMAATALVGLAGAMTAKLLPQAMALFALLLLCVWPWMPTRTYVHVFTWTRPIKRLPKKALLITPVWALLSPSGVMALYGLQMYWLNTVIGMALWETTLRYAAALFLGLSVLAAALRLIIRNWRRRLDLVMLLAFILLMAAMFLPQLYASVPPPASDIRVNWPATVALLLLMAGVVWHRMSRAGFSIRESLALNKERSVE